VIRADGGERGAGALAAVLPTAEDSPYLGRLSNLSDRYYRWCTQVDDAGLTQILGLFADPATAPLLTWWSSIVTDAGHHAGGTRSRIARDSLRDADRRLGAFLAHLDGLGVTDQVTFLLTADHGFEAADERVTGSWDAALDAGCRRLGVTYRDEGPGFVYLDV
jgi:predicted AlkP superfamily pyrophosphatase or phosphodiesterase